jgi:hypothetical protein
MGYPHSILDRESSTFLILSKKVNEKASNVPKLLATTTFLAMLPQKG